MLRLDFRATAEPDASLSPIERLAGCSLLCLELPERIVRTLHRARITRISELQEVAQWEVARIQGLDERELEALAAAYARLERGEGPEPPAAVDQEWIRRLDAVPLRALELPGVLPERLPPLLVEVLETVGDLVREPVGTLISAARRSAGLRAGLELVERFLRTPTARLDAVWPSPEPEEGAPGAVDLPAVIAVAGARSLGEEAHGLLAGLPLASRETLLLSWGWEEGRRAAPEEIAEHVGTSPAEAEELVVRGEVMLRERRLPRLPIARRTAELLAEARRPMTSEELLAAAARRRVPARFPALHVLPRLGELQIAPRVVHRPEADAWFAAAPGDAARPRKWSARATGARGGRTRRAEKARSARKRTPMQEKLAGGDSRRPAPPPAAQRERALELLECCPVTALTETGRAAARLEASGCPTVRSLHGIGTGRLKALAGIPEERARRIADAVELLAGLNPDRLAAAGRIDEEGLYHLPRAPAAVIHGVASARTLDDEIEALVRGRTEREAALLLAAWGYTASPPGSLEALAAAHGLAPREAAAATVAAERALESSGLRLPLAVRVTSRAPRGPTTPLDTLCEIAREEEVPASRRALAALPALAWMGLLETE